MSFNVVEYAVACDVGRVRKANQDNFVVCRQVKPAVETGACVAGHCTVPQLFAVCDGMGGEAHGELASFAAASVLAEAQMPGCAAELAACIEAADRRVFAEGEQAGEHRGTTTAVLVLNESGYIAANVGDSRIYQYANGQLQQLSKDHNEFQMMVDAGFYDADDTGARAGRSILTQCLGIHEDDIEPDPHIVEGQLKEGSIFLLCSDGFCGYVSNDKTASLLCAGGALEGIAASMVEAAKQADSTDNITVLLVRSCPCEETPTNGNQQEAEADGSSCLESEKGQQL